MQKHLIKLADYLDQNNLSKEADNVDALIKESLMGPTPQKIQEIKTQQKQVDPLKAKEYLHVALDLLGLVPAYGEAADLANAALYLSSGNVLLAGLSVVSMVPSLGDVTKVIKYGSKLAPEVSLQIAQLMLRHQGKIKAAFDVLKSPKTTKQKQAVSYITSYVPGGAELLKNTDRMWAEVRKWFYNILNTGTRTEVSDEVEQAEQKAEGLINQFNSQL